MQRVFNRNFAFRTLIAFSVLGALYGSLVVLPDYMERRKDKAATASSVIESSYQEIILALSSARLINGGSPSVYIEFSSARDTLENSLSNLKSYDKTKLDDEYSQRLTALIRNLEDVIADYDSAMANLGKPLQYSPKDNLGFAAPDKNNKPVIDDRLISAIDALTKLHELPSSNLTPSGGQKLSEVIDCLKTAKSLIESDEFSNFPSQLNKCDKSYISLRKELAKTASSVFNSAQAKETERLSKDLASQSL